MKVRRVVTGHNASGKAVFVSDGEVEPISVGLLPGVEFHRIWGADTPLQFPDEGSMPPHQTYFPPLGGFRFGYFTIPPGGSRPPSGGDLDLPDAQNELETKLPGLSQYLESDTPGMHTTPTVDCDLIIAGEMTLELDDGATVTLTPGDVVIQNGTRHRWRNEGTVPATLAYFICGARHDRA